MGTQTPKESNMPSSKSRCWSLVMTRGQPLPPLSPPSLTCTLLLFPLSGLTVASRGEPLACGSAHPRWHTGKGFRPSFIRLMLRPLGHVFCVTQFGRGWMSMTTIYRALSVCRCVCSRTVVCFIGWFWPSPALQQGRMLNNDLTNWKWGGVLLLCLNVGTSYFLPVDIHACPYV